MALSREEHEQKIAADIAYSRAMLQADAMRRGPEVTISDSPEVDGGSHDWKADRLPIAVDGVPGLLLLIDYKEPDDPDFAQRKVRVDLVSEGHAAAYIDGWCYLRNGPRCFRVDRMSEVVDLATGEAFDRGEDWLRARVTH